MGSITCAAECRACGEKRRWGRWGAEPWSSERDQDGRSREGDILLFCTGCGFEDMLAADARAPDSTPCSRCEEPLRRPGELRGEIPCPRCGVASYAVKVTHYR